MSWPSHSIAEIADIVTKGTTPTTLGKPFTDSGVIFIKAEALNGDSDLATEGTSFIDEDTHELLKRSILREGDVLVTIAGVNVGKCGFVRGEHLPANTNQAVGIVRINAQKAIPKFVYYFFKKPSTFAYCQCLGGQAAQPNINLGVLKSIPVPVPSLAVQHRIASILSAYDDLIENNRRRMELLERAARLLYEEWFVRLKFPGHERTRIVNGVPEGWEKLTLDSMATYINRGITPEYDDEAEGLVINQKCIRNRGLDLSLARRQCRDVPEEKRVQIGDVLVNSTGEGTLGRIAQVRSPITDCTVDSHVTIVRPIASAPWRFFGLAVMQYEPIFSTMGRGATNQTELSRAAIADLNILLPSSALVQQFEEFAEPVISQTENLAVQNVKLRTARDLLLPRLMSGEIEV